MAQGITDGLIQSIMASDIFALKEQFSVTGKKTAVSCPGLAVKRGTIGETVCKVKYKEKFGSLIELISDEDAASLMPEADDAELDVVIDAAIDRVLAKMAG